MRLDQVVEQDGLLPCDPGMISFIATEVMLLSMSCPWCVASTALSRQLGTTKILYMLP